MFGSNKVAYATIIWSYLLSRFLHKHNINIGFLAINPTINPDITHISQKEVLGIKILNPISICGLYSSKLVYFKTLDYREKIISISLPIIEETKEIGNMSVHQNPIKATKSLKLVDCMVKGNQIEFVF